MLPDAPGGVGANGVEVAQQDDAPFLVRGGQVAEDVLDDELGAAVRGHGLEGVLLIDGDVLGVAIHGARRGEDHLHQAARESKWMT